MATITLKNIPDDLYAALKAQAKAHRRSINGEVIHCLEAALRPRAISVDERLARLRALRSEIAQGTVSTGEIEQAIEDGRP